MPALNVHKRISVGRDALIGIDFRLIDLEDNEMQPIQDIDWGLMKFSDLRSRIIKYIDPF